MSDYIFENAERLKLQDCSDDEILAVFKADPSQREYLDGDNGFVEDTELAVYGDSVYRVLERAYTLEDAKAYIISNEDDAQNFRPHVRVVSVDDASRALQCFAKSLAGDS